MAERVQDAADELAQRLTDIALQITEVLPSKLREANVQQLASALGICIDKARVLRERASEILKVYGDDGISDEQRARAIVELLDAARAREAGRSAQGAE